MTQPASRRKNVAYTGHLDENRGLSENHAHRSAPVGSAMRPFITASWREFVDIACFPLPGKVKPEQLASLREQVAESVKELGKIRWAVRSTPLASCILPFFWLIILVGVFCLLLFPWILYLDYS